MAFILSKQNSVATVSGEALSKISKACFGRLFFLLNFSIARINWFLNHFLKVVWSSMHFSDYYKIQEFMFTFYNSLGLFDFPKHLDASKNRNFLHKFLIVQEIYLL